MGRAERRRLSRQSVPDDEIDGRTKAAAAVQIEESLNRLLTDRLDLLQFHENIRPDDADRIFAEGGALEAALAAKAAGKVRYIGFTGHKDPAYHLHMIEVARHADSHSNGADAAQRDGRAFQELREAGAAGRARA